MTRPWGWLWLGCVLGSALGCGGAAANGGTTVDGEGGGAAAEWQTAEDDPVAERMQQIAARLREAGLTVGSISGRGFLTMREQHTEAIEVPARTCVTLVAIAARGIRDVDATLFSPEGDVLAEDVEPDPHPAIQVCGGETGRRFYYGLHAYDGAGSYLFASFVGDRASFEAAARILGGRPGVVAERSEQGDQDARLRELAQGVARRGFRSQGDPLPVPLARDQRVRVPLETERGHCYTIAALSMGELVDVDLRILDELDREVAIDRSPSADATTQLCADRDAQLAVEVHAARGQGEARVALFEASGATVGGTSGLWLGERTEARVVQAPLEEAVESDLRAARATGWEAPARRGDGRLVAGEAIAHALRLPGGTCSRIVVSGGRGIGKLRLRIVSAAGEVLAEPAPVGPTAAATLCPDASAQVEAQVTARRGAGGYAVHVLRASAPSDVPADAPTAVRGALVEALEAATGDEWQLRQRPQRVVVGEEGIARVPVSPAAGRCTRVYAVASESITAELRRDEDLEARATGRARALTVCDSARDSGTPRVELRGPAGTAVWLTILDQR